MKILLTGCAGFIGSHAADLFLSLGYEVYGIDVVTYAGRLSNLDEANQNPNFQFEQLNICYTRDILDIHKKFPFEWVVNFAAETHVDNSIKNSDVFIQANIIGVKSLLDVCKATGAKLLHASTDEVYGTIEAGMFMEHHPLEPKNPYSATKAAGEHLVRAFANTYGVDYLIVRPSNNFGPRQHAEKFLPTIINNILAGKKIPVYGNGKNVREWLYVKENVRAIEFLLSNFVAPETYNISSKYELSNIDVVSKVLVAFGKSTCDEIEFMPDRPGHDARYAVSTAKLTQKGFAVEVDFDKHLKETINFYQNASNKIHSSKP